MCQCGVCVCVRVQYLVQPRVVAGRGLFQRRRCNMRRNLRSGGIELSNVREDIDPFLDWNRVGCVHEVLLQASRIRC